MSSNDCPRRLLIVEDNPTDVMILRRAIHEHGLNIEIVVAEDGDKAIDYLENCCDEKIPHLIVIDINLPKRDGIEVLRKCRFIPSFVGTKTLVFTSSDESSDRRRSELLGVDAYVRKPIQVDDFTAVVSTIRKLLGIDGHAAGRVDPLASVA